VCPDCLTPAEERALAEGFVRLLERDAGRLATARAEPSPHEAALAAYAMRLRAELESPAARPPPVSGPPPYVLSPPPPPPPPPEG
jgi:hypothetical protein